MSLADPFLESLRLLAAVLAVAAPEMPPAERPALAFSAGIEVVSLGVTVTDTHNRYVGDLRERDFAVFEDGVRQQPILFEREEVPISLVLMIDASASMGDTLEAAQSAAIRLVRALRAQDRAQIVQFADRTQLLQDFTSDQAVLEAAVRGVRASGFTRLRNALYDVLKRIARQRAAEGPQRWAVVLLSDGEDTSSLVTEDDVLDLARKAGVPIHTIGLRPRRTPRDTRLALARAWHFLAALAQLTGGESYLSRSTEELAGVYDRIGDSLRTQYLLGYVSTNLRRDGGWRRIVVRVPQRTDLAARHRGGYYARSR